MVRFSPNCGGGMLQSWRVVGALCAPLLSGCLSGGESLIGTAGGGGTETLSEGSSAASVSTSVTSDERRSDAGAATSSDATGSAVDDAGTDLVEVTCAEDVLPTSQVRFLTSRQYDRTLRDLLGIDGLSEHDNQLPSFLLAPESKGAITQLGWQGYRAAGQAVAAQVMAEPQLRERFVTCDLADGDSCLLATVSSFGRRAFRRPLSAVETDSFARLVAAGADLPAEEVAEIVLEAFLVSPSFLTRTELNQQPVSDGVYVLSNYEIASRLSYFLWGSMPDAELFAAAEEGSLATPEGVRAAAERMLEDDKARGMVNDFVEGYLRFRHGAWSTAKDEAVFPEYTEAVRAAMVGETQRFFQLVVLGGGTLEDLLQSPVAFVNADLASLYGLDATNFGSELEQVELSERPGFLTRVGFLSAFSAFDNTSPMKRGTFITNEVVGNRLVPEIALNPLPPPSNEWDTVRQRSEAQTSPAECMGCHQFINPPGFVLENFDAIGRKQTHERVTGAPIDTVVEWSLDGETRRIATPTELMHALAQSEMVRTEYARRWAAFAFEADATAKDACIVTSLAQALARDGYTQLDLLVDLTQTAQFLTRVPEAP